MGWFNMNDLSQLHEMLSTSGDHAVRFAGVAGLMEGQLMVPKNKILPFIAMLGHPHSLQGGTMNNKVVTAAARALESLGIASLRFNFRGVGNSAGRFDHGLGESEDMLLAVAQCQSIWPSVKFIFAGFSFGSYVAYRAASQYKNVLLLTIAPPVHHFDYTAFPSLSSPWHVIGGLHDEIVERHFIESFLENNKLMLPIHWVDTGHFFHGRLLVLKNIITGIVQEDVLT